MLIVEIDFYSFFHSNHWQIVFLWLRESLDRDIRKRLSGLFAWAICLFEMLIAAIDWCPFFHSNHWQIVFLWLRESLDRDIRKRLSGLFAWGICIF
jgi:hypothetical protein